MVPVCGFKQPSRYIPLNINDIRSLCNLPKVKNCICKFPFGPCIITVDGMLQVAWILAPWGEIVSCRCSYTFGCKCCDMAINQWSIIMVKNRKIRQHSRVLRKLVSVKFWFQKLFQKYLLARLKKFQTFHHSVLVVSVFWVITLVTRFGIPCLRCARLESW